ncbi:MAG: hypothetical protein NHF90_00590 [Candidatus Shikimatogenerans sp. JK-2022]|nr:hypothetical protein [Candidatus Shikimatogenerans bostrichidophilus]
MKLLYINIYNNKINSKSYINKIIKNIYKIYNIYRKKINNNNNYKNINNNIKKYLLKIKNNYNIQYEEKEILKYILYLNIKNKIKFNIFKFNNINFFFSLYNITKKKNNVITNIIKKKIINWEINRINIIDIIILKMAISEFFFIKKNSKYINIIIYEYINIINLFSTFKSISFINAILDNIFKNIKIK